MHHGFIFLVLISSIHLQARVFYHSSSSLLDGLDLTLSWEVNCILRAPNNRSL